jgi:hypothetical protein
MTVHTAAGVEVCVSTSDDDGALIVEVMHPCDWPESAAGPEGTRVWVNDGLVFPDNG